MKKVMTLIVLGAFLVAGPAFAAGGTTVIDHDEGVAIHDDGKGNTAIADADGNVIAQDKHGNVHVEDEDGNSVTMDKNGNVIAAEEAED